MSTTPSSAADASYFGVRGCRPKVLLRWWWEDGPEFLMPLRTITCAEHEYRCAWLKPQRCEAAIKAIHRVANYIQFECANSDWNLGDDIEAALEASEELEEASWWLQPEDLDVEVLTVGGDTYPEGLWMAELVATVIARIVERPGSASPAVEAATQRLQRG